MLGSFRSLKVSGSSGNAVVICKTSGSVRPQKCIYLSAISFLVICLVGFIAAFSAAESTSSLAVTTIDLTPARARNGETMVTESLPDKATANPFGIIASGNVAYPKVVNLITDLGANWLRINSHLDGKDQNFKLFLDANVNLVITFNNADPANIETTYGTIAEWPNAGFPFKSRAAYQQRIRESLAPIQAYLTQGRVWVQCENEVSDASLNENSRFWRGTTDEYLIQLEAFHEVVRSIDLSIPIVLTSFASEALDAVLDPSDIRHNFATAHLVKLLTGQYDSVDLHFYGCVEDIPDKIQWVKERMPAGKIYISTENGGPDSRCPNTPKSWQEDPILFEQLQAEQVPARLTACADNNSTICLWFSLFDLRNENDVFAHLGLLDPSVEAPRKKPAYEAFKSFAAPHDLRVSINPPSAGSVTGPGINCPDDCTESYSSLTPVELTATPKAGYHFVDWSGDISSTNNPVAFRMDMDLSVTANFAINSNNYVLTVTKAGTGSGTVTSNPSGIDCGSDCSEAYNEGTNVTLTATPASGSIFGGWSGDLSGTANPTSVTMNGPKNVVVNFTQNQYTLTVNITPPGSGVVTKNPDKASYAYGEQVQLTATANTGCTFNNWSGDVSGSTNPTTITMNGNKTVTANFAVTSVTPTAYDFGNVKVKRSKTAFFVVKNSGKTNLSITSAITGTDASMFKITSGGGSKTIKPGKSLTIKVAFKPTSKGSKSTNLEITPDDPFRPIIDISLSGTSQ